MSHPRPITADESASILSMVDAGMTLRQIAATVRRGYGTVSGHLRELREQAADEADPCRLKPPAAARDRQCLGCGKTFASQGPHNRQCVKCRGRDVSPYAIG